MALKKSKNTNNSITLAKMPDAGLGNKLFSLAHAFIFANNHNLPIFYSGLSKFKLGPYLRREKSKRLYKNLLIPEKKFNPRKQHDFKQNFIDYRKCNKFIEISDNSIYIFNQMPSWKDHFLHIRENRNLVRNKLFEYFQPSIVEKYEKKSSPTIGIHIRMGDFRPKKESEDFAKVGLVRTPLSYFTNLISNIREIAGYDMDVSIFSDGYEHELKEILSLPNTRLAEDDSDILHLLHLSKSKILILSAGSTFSQWAAFLSSGVVINHFQHFHAYIRDNETNKAHFEGICKPNEDFNPLLLSNIKNLTKQ